MTKEQQEKLGCVFMWYADWQKALYADWQHMPHEEVMERAEQRQWYAHMTNKGAKELGLDTDVLFGDGFARDVRAYKNYASLRALAKTKNGD